MSDYRDPLKYDVRRARAEGSTIEMIARIWKISEDEVRNLLKGSLRRIKKTPGKKR